MRAFGIERGRGVVLATAAILLGCSAPPPRSAQGSASAVARAGAVAVGPEVQVSPSDSEWRYAEYVADIDPTNADRMVVCATPFNPAWNERHSVLFTSHDRGKSWRLAKVDSAARPGLINTDPMCGYTADGDLLFVTLASEDTLRPRGYGTWDGWALDPRMRVYRSGDQGQTWHGPQRIGYIDNENLLVDRTGGRYHGRTYIHGFTDDFQQSPNKLWLIYSTDGGRTFTRSAPTAVNGPWIQLDAGTVLADGTVLLPYVLVDRDTSAVTMAYAVARSTDGGEHLSPLVGVAPSHPACSEMQVPNMAADHSGGDFRGRAYHLSVGRLAARGSGSAGPCVLRVRYSDDGGVTWSPPVQVNDTRRRTSAPEPADVLLTSIFLPAIAVNRHGVIGVTWYDRHRDPSNGLTSAQLRFAASLDGGESWLPSVPVTSRPLAARGLHGLSALVFSSGGRRRVPVPPSSVMSLSGGIGYPLGGDYATLVADDVGTFHAFWVDNRGDPLSPIRLYTAPVMVTGAATKHGAPELRPLADVTSLLELQVRSTATQWTDSSVALDMGYVLFNRSDSTLVAPLKLRVLEVRSALGPTQVLLDGAGDGTRKAGAGAILDITSALPAGGLAPGQMLALQWLRTRVYPIDGDVSDFRDDAFPAVKIKLYGAIRRSSALMP